ncbi:MAG: hypothetical protein ACJA0N_001478 [Pseudohongiellaceae bacterium]|jgi:hypothetical protein
MSLAPSLKPVLLLVLALFLSVSNVAAHEIRPAVVDLLISDKVILTLNLNLEALVAEVGAEHEDTDQSSNAAEYKRLRAMTPVQLQVAFAQYGERLIAGIELTVNKLPVELQITSVNIPAETDLDLARSSLVVFESELTEFANTISWQWQPEFGAAALRVSSAEQQDIYTAYLLSGAGSGEVVITAEAQASSSIISNYLRVGFTHILPKGLDHILFVVGLFLLSASIRSLLWQISSFTLAHTITLALGMSGILQLSSAIVEPIIAASIVYVCVENIFSDRLSRFRPPVVFVFGLLHGLGFAGVLTEIGLSDSHFVTGLVAFNVGVELGQLAVIALCFGAVGWWQQRAWYRQRIAIPASAAIAMVGCYWVLERTLLA